MTLTVNTESLFEHTCTVLKARRVPMVHGSPGVGKSDLARKIADHFNLFLIDFRMACHEPTDLTGFPVTNAETRRSSYAPFTTFPLKGDPVPAGYDGWLLFFDELSSADRSMQKGAYKILLDRMVGQDELHPNVAMMAAGNLATDNAIVDELGTAMQSRLIHFELEFDLECFLRWASTNDIHHYITDFLKFRPELAYKFDPNHSDKTFPCSRTWHFASDILKAAGDVSPGLIYPIAGAVSEGPAREFIAYVQVYSRLPAVDDILAAPKVAAVPDEPGTIYALTGILGKAATEANIEKMMEYIERLPIEFQITCLRECVRRGGQAIKDTPTIKKWTRVNAAELM
jgi:hypothetical protein